MNQEHINKVQLVGDVAAKPECKVTDTGRSMARLKIKTVRKGRDKDYSEFHNVVIWGDLAHSFERVQMGDFVSIDGRLQTRSYQKNGQKLYYTQVVAEDGHIIKGLDNSTTQAEQNSLPF